MAEQWIIEIAGTSLIVGLAIIMFIFLAWVFRRNYHARSRKRVWMFLGICLLLPLNQIVLPFTYSIEVSQTPSKPLEHLTPKVEATGASDESKAEAAAPLAGADGKMLETTKNKHPWGQILSILWSGVALCLFLYYLTGYWKLCCKMRRWSVRCEDERIETKASAIAEELGLNSIPEIRMFKQATSGPFTMGIFKKMIYLPDEALAEHELSYILKHELIHCKEKDILWKMLLLGVNIVHWFNPFVWLMRKLADNDMEQLCDEEVLRDASMKERQDYCAVIMSWIEKSNREGNVLSAGYSKEIKLLKWRFANICNCSDKRNGRGLFVSVFVVILFLSIMVHIGKSQTADSGIVMAEGMIAFGQYKDCSIRLVMTDGKYYTLEESVPGGGTYEENYEGQYVLQLVDADEKVRGELSLNDDWDYAKINFPGNFVIDIDDYNNDAYPDFVIGNYGSSSMNTFWIYTVYADGTIHNIGEFADTSKEFSMRLKMENGSFYSSVWNNATGEEVRTEYRWNSDTGMYIPKEL